MKPDKQEKIAWNVIKTLLKRFETFPLDASNNRNAPFHEAFLNAFKDKFNDKVSDIPFFISLSSWLHGLNTTLGQTFFENVAHILSDGEKREYTSKKLGNVQIGKNQKNNVAERMTELSNGTIPPNMDDENKLVFIDHENNFVNSMDFSADVFIEDEDTITAIELKSVKPNSGEMRGEKQKILEGKAALHKLFPNKKINFYMGFPFDPTSSKSTEYDKDRFLGSIINMIKFFDPNETLIANELWDFLSSERNTMESILQIINTISTTDFIKEFQFLNEANNRSNPDYIVKLEKWFLFSEVKLVNNDQKIQQAVKNNKQLQRVYNQQIFHKDEYNERRMNTLSELI
ncbi:TdeIII family type II restriction endonuclease [Patescibacteria group bacterium]|nr:TdeIII family type II restriction endonuclease [Patescibacteria group bacterium]MBU1124309.1 TdeIII family type II restriction endonuclease [Patescibacteria group bacterium]